MGRRAVPEPGRRASAKATFRDTFQIISLCLDMFDAMSLSHEQLQKTRVTKSVSLINECSFPPFPDISGQDGMVLFQ